jgi:hypothetical protein
MKEPGVSTERRNLNVRCLEESPIVVRRLHFPRTRTAGVRRRLNWRIPAESSSSSSGSPGGAWPCTRRLRPAAVAPRVPERLRLVPSRAHSAFLSPPLRLRTAGLKPGSTSRRQSAQPEAGSEKITGPGLPVVALAQFGDFDQRAPSRRSSNRGPRPLSSPQTSSGTCCGPRSTKAGV